MSKSITAAMLISVSLLSAPFLKGTDEWWEISQEGQNRIIQTGELLTDLSLKDSPAWNEEPRPITLSAPLVYTTEIEGNLLVRCPFCFEISMCRKQGLQNNLRGLQAHMIKKHEVFYSDGFLLSRNPAIR